MSDEIFIIDVDVGEGMMPLGRVSNLTSGIIKEQRIRQNNPDDLKVFSVIVNSRLHFTWEEIIDAELWERLRPKMDGTARGGYKVAIRNGDSENILNEFLKAEANAGFKGVFVPTPNTPKKPEEFEGSSGQEGTLNVTYGFLERVS